MINQTLGRVDVQAVTPEVFSPGPSTPVNFDPVQYLIQHGYAQLTTLQPASRFWPFHSIEGGWLLALSLLHHHGHLAGPLPRRLNRLDPSLGIAFRCVNCTLGCATLLVP